MFFDRTKYSLNEISHDAAIDLIRKVIESGAKVAEVNNFVMHAHVPYV